MIGAKVAPDEHRLEYQRPFLYPKQHAAIFDPRRYSITEASTKSGKTSGAIVWIIEQALAGRDGWNYWWVAPVSGQADIAFRRTLRALPRHLSQPNITLKTITLINGAVIWFKSGDKPDSLYGEDVYAAVVDEASRTKEDAWYALRSTLTATRGPVRIIGNVKGRRNWFFAIARKAEAGAPDMGYHKLVAADAIEAGVLAQDEVEDARRNLPDRVFRELYLAEPSDDEGNPFGLTAIASNVTPLSGGTPAVWGWDLAKHVDWTAGIALDEVNRVCRFERFQLPWDATMNRIIDLTRRTPALVDSTGVGDPIVEMLQKRPGTRFEGYGFTGPSKQKLMEGLAVAIQSHSITYPAGVITMELENFEYQYTRSGVHYCVDPATPVLTKDLRWVEAGTLRVGDGLLAFDENPRKGEKTRCWRSSIVTSASEIVRPCYRVALEDGTTLIVSAEHLWLIESAGRLEWRKTEDLQAPHPTSRSLRDAPAKIIKLVDVWDVPISYATGYLAAAFDGEGSIVQRERGDHKGHAARLLFSQNENAMAQQVRGYLRELGFSWSESFSQRCIKFGLTGRRHEMLRFLGHIRPARLLAKFNPDALGTLDKKQAVTVKSIEAIGDRAVTALGTTTKTFIAAGFASHNSAPEGFHDDCVCALALAVMHRSHARKPVRVSDAALAKSRMPAPRH